MKIRFRKQIFEGDTDGLVKQIDVLRNRKDLSDIPTNKKAELDQIKDEILLLKSESTSIIKERLIDYLEAVYNYIDFKERYNNILLNTAKSLEKEAKSLNRYIEKSAWVTLRPAHPAKTVLMF